MRVFELLQALRTQTDDERVEVVVNGVPGTITEVYVRSSLTGINEASMPRVVLVATTRGVHASRRIEDRDDA